MLGVQVELDRAVALGCGGGKDFHNQIGRAADVVWCDDFRAFVRDEQYVWLYNVCVRQHNIERGKIDSAQAALSHERA